MNSVAAGILVRGGEVLLCHRHPERLSYPNVWDLPGGHVDPGETPQQTAHRELGEELGINAVVPATAWRVIQGDGDMRLHLFVVGEWEGEIRNTEPLEHDELCWFEVDELSRLELAHDSFRDLLRSVMARTKASGGNSS